MVTPSTCCRKSGEGCVCAAQAKCSCGAKAALHCTCAKAQTENEVKGPRCSCRARPAGECTCERAATENATPSGSLCSCGARPAGKLSAFPSIGHTSSLLNIIILLQMHAPARRPLTADSCQPRPTSPPGHKFLIHSTNIDCMHKVWSYGRRYGWR
ncbi:hypothetical protein BGZ57DRAFT_892619 [Hyaloscypha finlandica]|nr:hypothetical protein BGZ57DRAFT_892619 [Hyaloscypha finlandica]